jgi:hypothetical protein
VGINEYSLHLGGLSHLFQTGIFTKQHTCNYFLSCTFNRVALITLYLLHTNNTTNYIIQGYQKVSVQLTISSKCPPPVSRHLSIRRTVFSKAVFSTAWSTFQMYSVMAIFNCVGIVLYCNRQVHRDFLITLYYYYINMWLDVSVFQLQAHCPS